MDKIELPEKRARATSILYARVKPINKRWLQRKARKLGHTVSSYVDEWIDKLRANASKKPPKSD